MIWDDLRAASKKVRKNKAATAAVASILALGIGASVTTFTVADSVLLRPLPFPHAERLVTIYEQNLAMNLPQMLVSLPSFEHWLEESRSFEALAAYQFNQPVTLTGDGEATRLETNFVTTRYFELLGAEPELGRLFTPDEHAVPMQSPVAVVSHAFWQGRLGGRSEVVGSTLTLSGTPFTVVGVLSPGFVDLPSNDRATQVWLPLAMYPVTGYGWELLERRTTRFLATVARLRPEITLDQARAEMGEIAAHLAREYPESHAGYSLVVQPVRDNLLGTFRPAILALVFASGFVLLIGCANAANLLLVRASQRRQEVAVQLALGLGSRRLVRQLIFEGLITAGLAGIVGIGLARLGIELLLRSSPVSLPSFISVRFEPRVLVVAAALTLTTGLLFALVPAAQGLDGNLRDVLYRASRGGGGGRLGARGRKGLIVVEVATAVLLLAGALLMIRSFGALEGTEVGFDTDDLLVLRADLPGQRFAELETMISFSRALEERLAAEPGVSDVVLWGPDVPGQALWYRGFAPEGKVMRSLEDAVAARYHAITADGLRALGIPLVAGRGIERQDRADSQPVVVVSESAARAFFPDSEALGRRIYRYRPGTGNEEEPLFTIVGITADTHLGGRAIAGVGTLDVYFSYPQLPQRNLAVLVRSGRKIAPLAAAVRRAVAELDSDLPLYDLATMEERLAREEQQSRFSAFLIASFAGVSLLLAGLGLYSVIAYTVRERTHEVGIRLALGGRPRDVVTTLVMQAGGPVVLGLVLGLSGIAYATRFLSGFLYGTAAGDPLTYVAVVAVMGGVAVLGALLPLRRAARVDPVVALRAE